MTSDVKNANINVDFIIGLLLASSLICIADAKTPIIKAIHTPRIPHINILHPIECGIVNFLLLILAAIISPRVASMANLINDST